MAACVLSFKHKRGAVIAKNVNLPPRLSYHLLYLRGSAFYCVSSCFDVYFNGPIIGPILMSDKILLVCGARLKLDNKSIHFAKKQTKETAEMTVWTVIIRVGFEQCYIFLYLNVSNCPIVIAVVLFQDCLVPVRR